MEEHLAHVTMSARRILAGLPAGVIVVAAAKTRTPAEVQAVVDAGITHIGHNYVQEAQAMRGQIHGEITWHMIGHLQRNKVKSAVEVFDLIETVDSVALAHEIERRCAALDKVMPVLIEVNSGREPNKTGVWPEEVETLARQIAGLEHLRLQGLMTMGPLTEDGEALRPYFRLTRSLFEHLERLQLPGVEMRYLSMGMSGSYRVAVQEGANVVRIGTALFGPRTAG